MNKTALLLLANGCEETEVTTTFDILIRGNVNVVMASITHSLTVQCSRGMQIIADTLLDSVRETPFDAVILPGGLKGAENFSQSSEVIERLRLTHQQKGIVAAICASPALVLQQHQLFPHAKMTGYPSTQLHFSVSQWAEQRVYYDEKHRVLTSQGPATSIDFALELLNQLHGKNCAHNVATQLVLPEGINHYLI